MKIRKLLSLIPALAFLVLLAACTSADPTPTATPELEAPKAKLYVFSNSTPHITEIDAETNRVLRTADIPGMTSLGWNDDKNYYDGENLWLGTRDRDAGTSELLLLNLDTLTVTKRIPLGSNPANIYISQASSLGQVFVGLQGNMDQAGEIVVIDAASQTIIKRIPVNQIACDVDISVGPDGIERVFIPNQRMDAVQNLDAGSHVMLNTVSQPEGSNPFMLTASPDGKYVWVQDGSANTNSILDVVTLATVTRLPTGKGPIVATFSPDGRYGYVGHSQDTIVAVIDTETFRIVKRIEVGANPSKLAVHPNGQYLYATVGKENAVAVIDTSTWQVIERIEVEASPGGMFLRTL